MRTKSLLRISSGVALALALSATTFGVAGATARPTSTASLSAHASKTITCYSKTGVAKKVTAANPKCPAGYSLTKPVTTTTAKSESVALSATYTGSASLLWTSSTATITSMTGTGTGTTAGLTSITNATGKSPYDLTQGTMCNPLSGQGTLSGSTGSITIQFVPGSSPCSTSDQSAPYTVKVSGTATILSGTGIYAGATGTLTLKGSAVVSTATTGSNQATFTATVSGTFQG